MVFELPKGLSQEHSDNIFWSLVFHRLIKKEVQDSKARGPFKSVENDGTNALENMVGRE
jgi:hypothetical protein